MSSRRGEIKTRRYCGGLDGPQLCAAVLLGPSSSGCLGVKSCFVGVVVVSGPAEGRDNALSLVGRRGWGCPRLPDCSACLLICAHWERERRTDTMPRAGQQAADGNTSAPHVTACSSCNTLRLLSNLFPSEGKASSSFLSVSSGEVKI